MKIEEYDPVSTTSRARTSNVSTIITSSAHNLITGETVTISGLGGSDYNDSDVTVTVTDTVTFTYANTGSNEGTTADTAGNVYANFTFPYSSNLHSEDLGKFVDQRDYAYAFSYFGMTNPIKSKKAITINGHFNGTNKSTDYNFLYKHCNSNKIKKLYFSTDKFAIVFPITCKRTDTGSRTNFIDYVAPFVSPFGILFDDTQKSGNNSASGKNEGNTLTPIEKITGTVTDTQLVTIQDGEGNGFTFTANASGTVTIELITLLDLGSDNYFTEYIYASIGGTRQVLKVANNSKSMLLSLGPGQSLSNLFSGGTVTNITTPLFFFRDGHSSD